MATAAVPSPYQPGRKLEIRKHTPPQPYGAYYKNEETVRTPVRRLVDWSGNAQVDHLDFVLSNPPLKTPTLADAKSHVITIIDTIHHRPKKDGGGPYVLSCYLNADRSCQYVAKIYDGFEYKLAKSEYDNDCMWKADLHYSREAAAYESIPSRFQGTIVPRYFGSWTFQLAIGIRGRRRWVRMILIEYIHGESMLDIIRRAQGLEEGSEQPRPVDYRLLPPERERLDILARVVEAEIAIWWYGCVLHLDMAPRNVMICRSPNARSRIVIIDFNAAYVLSRCQRGRQLLAYRGPDNTLPISPIERYWPGTSFSWAGKFCDWIPESWRVADPDTSDLLALDWLRCRWKGSPNFQPMSEEFLSSSRMHECDDHVNGASRN